MKCIRNGCEREAEVEITIQGTMGEKPSTKYTCLEHYNEAKQVVLVVQALIPGVKIHEEVIEATTTQARSE